MLILADARHIPLSNQSVQCVVTSPPYFGLRDYGIEPRVWGGDEGCGHEWGDEIVSSQRQRNGAEGGLHDGRDTNGLTEIIKTDYKQGSFCLRCHAWRGVLGLEPTPELYVQHIVEVFREVRRVLRDDGTAWVNLGDSYASNPASGGPGQQDGGEHQCTPKRQYFRPPGLKPKDLVGIPWRVAFALQTDGADSPQTMERVGRLIDAITDSYETRDEWPDRIRAEVERLEREWRDAHKGAWWLRSDIIWSKPNPMPESVTDRPTKSHEYIFLLTKSENYFCDMEAIKEPHVRLWDESNGGGFAKINHELSAAKKIGQANNHYGNYPLPNPAGRNKRTVWTVATQPYPDAHFATFPEDLIKPCILAGTSQRGACVECGAPWERVVERERWATRPGNAIKVDLSRNDNGRNDRIEMQSKTLGWRPGCGCYGYVITDKGATDFSQAIARLCIVLDPFGGSCTTVKVAQDLGRYGIGLDLKPDYLRMGKLRAAQLGLAV